MTVLRLIQLQTTKQSLPIPIVWEFRRDECAAKPSTIIPSPSRSWVLGARLNRWWWLLLLLLQLQTVRHRWGGDSDTHCHALFVLEAHLRHQRLHIRQRHCLHRRLEVQHRRHRLACAVITQRQSVNRFIAVM